MVPILWRYFIYIFGFCRRRQTDKQVFSDLDFLGWYTTGEAPTTADLHVHKQICDIYESPIMLQMNPQTRNVDVNLVCVCLMRYIFVISIFNLAIANRIVRINIGYCSRRSDHDVCSVDVHIGHRRGRTYRCRSRRSHVDQ